jgi:hypothetical protein
MDIIKVYLASELKELHPKGFESAHKSWVEDHSSDIFNLSEIMDSMKAIFKQCGVNLINWSISDSSPSWVRFEMPESDDESEDGIFQPLEDYTGSKALNWVKSELELKSIKRVPYSYKDESGRKLKGVRYDITKKGGESWSCGFTGVCYDHDFIDSLLEDIHDGRTLSESFHGLADKAGKLFENEYKDQMSESYFVEHADANDYKFTEDGIQV